MAAALDRGALVLTSSARLAGSLRRQYSRGKKQAGATQWSSPRILSWSGWLNDLWKLCLYQGVHGVPLLLNTFQERMLWNNAIRQSPEAAHLLQLDSTAAAAQQAWNLLHRYRIPMQRSAFEDCEDSAAFFEWTRLYRARTKRLNALDAARLSDWIRDRFVQGALAVPAQLWLAGFENTTPQQEVLLKTIEGAGCPIVESQFLDLPCDDIVLRPCPDEASEMYAAAAWAREKVERDPGCSAGIVTPHLAEARASATRAFQEVLGDAFHLTTGSPLGAVPIVHSALLVLETFRPRLERETATSILLSPYLAAGEEERGVRALRDAALRSHGGVHMPLQDLAGADCPHLSAAVRRCEKVPDALPPSAWARLFAERLQNFGWLTGALLDDGEAQAVEDWRQALTDLSSLDLVSGDLTASEALSRIRRIVWDSVCRSEDAGQPIHLMSIAESSGADFDHLWILGMHEDAWPAAPAPAAFVPIALQTAYKVPGCTPRAQLEEAAGQTRRLLAAAGEIVVSYPMMLGECSAGPSPLVAHLRAVATSAPHVHWYLRPAELESYADDTAPPLPEGSFAHGGTRALKLQAACPFQAFATVRLGARPLESPDLGIDQRERGNLVHKAMELIWRRLRSQENLLEISPGQLDSLVADSVAEALRIKLLPGGAFHDKVKAMEIARMSQMLHEWLALERERGPFHVVACEQERDITLAGLHLSTRVDRVDQLPDGSQVLLDYKTTAPSPDTWDGRRPDQPQLPLYALGLGAPLAAAAFAQIRTGALKFRGRAAQEGVLPGLEVVENFPQLAAGWRTVLEELATNYREGRAEVDPKTDSTCGYCRLHSLCRIHE